MPPAHINHASSSREGFPVSRLELQVTHVPRPFDIDYPPPPPTPPTARHHDDVHRRYDVTHTPYPDHVRHPPRRHDVTTNTPRHHDTHRRYDVVNTPYPYDVRHSPRRHDVSHAPDPYDVKYASRHHTDATRRRNDWSPYTSIRHHAAERSPTYGYWYSDEYDGSAEKSRWRDDHDELRSHYSVGRRDGDADRARVRLYTHASPDPDPYTSCTCLYSPRVSTEAIPSMQYELARCVCHPWRRPRRVKQDIFTYPWTVQTYRPTKELQFGYRQGQVTPISAVTAPPFTLYNTKLPHPKQHPPHSAPVYPPSRSLLSAQPSDRRLRRVDRQRLAATRSFLPPVEEDVTPFDSASQVSGPAEEELSPLVEVSPFDSISQVSPRRDFRSPLQPRLRYQREREREKRESDLRRARRHTTLQDPDDLRNSPGRLFKEEQPKPGTDGDVARAKARRLNTV